MRPTHGDSTVTGSRATHRVGDGGAGGRRARRRESAGVVNQIIYGTGGPRQLEVPGFFVADSVNRRRSTRPTGHG